MPNLYNTGGQFSGGMSNPSYGGTANNPWPNPWGPASSYIPANMMSTWNQMQNPSGNRSMGASMWQGPGSSNSVLPWGRGLINQGTGYTPNIQAGTSGVDPMQVIQAQMPAIQENLQRNFAGAGSRFGAAGMLASGGTGSGYAASLGDQSRKASTDVASLYWQVMNDASQRQADRDQQAYLAQAEQLQRQAELQAQTGMGLGQWDVDANRSMWDWMMSNQNQHPQGDRWTPSTGNGNNAYWQNMQGSGGGGGSQFMYGPYAPAGWQTPPSYMNQNIDMAANQAYWQQHPTGQQDAYGRQQNQLNWQQQQGWEQNTYQTQVQRDEEARQRALTQYQQNPWGRP